MKKVFLKKLVSFGLSISVCASATLVNTYAVWPDCNSLNKEGKFDDETCAIVDSIDKISSGERFIKLNNVGRKSEYDLLFFDSNEINGVLTNLTYNKNVDQVVAMKEYQLEKSNEAISGGICSFGIGVPTFNILKNIYNALNLPNGKKEHGNGGFMQLAANPRLMLQRIQNVAILIPLALATGVSALISGLACSVNSYFKNKDINDFIMSSKIEKDNYFFVLENILDFIKDGTWKINKILCVSKNSNNNEAVVKILSKKGDRDYNLDEQNKFNESIENLKENIISILNQENESR